MPDFETPRFTPAITIDHAEVLVDFVRAYYAEDNILFDQRKVALALKRMVAEPTIGRAYFIGIPESYAAGYVVFTFGFDHEAGGPLATVTDLFVDPVFRRRGLARAALGFVAETCRTLGVRGLELQVEMHNVAGQALYRGFGFRAHPRLPMFLPLD